jgi:glutamate dehydrogenase (NAD(P)+)
VDPEHVLAMISTKMRQNTLTIVNEARDRHLTTQAAAQRLSQERVRAAMALRGQIPPEGGDHPSALPPR